MVKEDNSYDTIRVAEPDIFDYKWQPIIQFTQPTAMSRLRENKNKISHCFERKDFNLLDMYFKPNPEENERQWKNLQIRNCKVNSKKVK